MCDEVCMRCAAGCQNDVMMVNEAMKGRLFFIFQAVRKNRRKEKRDVWKGEAAGREEVNEQYMSVERAEGEKKKERQGFRFDVGVFLTAIILQPTEFHQHKLC